MLTKGQKSQSSPEMFTSEYVLTNGKDLLFFPKELLIHTVDQTVDKDSNHIIFLCVSVYTFRILTGLIYRRWNHIANEIESLDIYIHIFYSQSIFEFLFKVVAIPQNHYNFFPFLSSLSILFSYFLLSR
jgi:hypothetical protein